jgi:hypothetical protein
VEAETLDDQDRQLAIEVPTTETIHDRRERERERENTYVKTTIVLIWASKRILTVILKNRTVRDVLYP